MYIKDEERYNTILAFWNRMWGARGGLSLNKKMMDTALSQGQTQSRSAINNILLYAPLWL